MQSKYFSTFLQFVSHPFLFKRVKLRWQRGSPFRSAGVLHILLWSSFVVLETILTPLLLPLIGYTFYRDQKRNRKRNQMKETLQRKPKETIPESREEQLELVPLATDQTAKHPEVTPEDGNRTKEQSGNSFGGKGCLRDMGTSTFNINLILINFFSPHKGDFILLQGPQNEQRNAKCLFTIYPGQKQRLREKGRLRGYPAITSGKNDDNHHHHHPLTRLRWHGRQ